MTTHQIIEERFAAVAPTDVGFWSLRIIDQKDELLEVRQDVVQPPHLAEQAGVMVIIVDGDGIGYAGTCDTTAAGLRRAVDEARRWASLCKGRGVADFSGVDYPHPVGEYASRAARPWASVPMGEKIDELRARSVDLSRAGGRARDDRIVDWEASLWHTTVDSLFVTSGGGRVRQRFELLVPHLAATANEGARTQSRTLGARGFCRQGGLEILDADAADFAAAAPRIAGEALELLGAPDCPSGAMDVLLAPDQMYLQIHESIGHPLELDRILGDERNYAGRSFVTPEMFGTYRYGSDLLDVSFDPEPADEFASYGFDDEGAPARRELIIEKGILMRGLGGVTSQQRTGLAGVACSRATSWNRAPIDRMANLNLEPGSATLDEMVARVERGVYMKTNCSWSIDDSRNKFQFGCEWGQRIENGKLTDVVRNPNYRGVSATFWRSLVAVGNGGTVEVLGSPFCGKGEPNQVIRVGHASPACLFTDVDVFGSAG